MSKPELLRWVEDDTYTNLLALHFLRRARERISDPSNWAKEAYALDSYGVSVPVQSPSACAWCAVGAVVAEPLPLPSCDIFMLVNIAQGWGGEVVAHQPLIEFNDSHTHAEVLAVFDSTIQQVEAVFAELGIETQGSKS